MPQAEPDYGLADRLGAGGMVFFPRRDDSPAPPGAFDHAIEVAPGVVLGARLYFVGAGAPTILYFHGNGEVVSDHDDVSEFYREIGVNLFVVDFRGYGRSSGRPTVASLVSDAGPIVARFHAILDAQQFGGMRLVMGRSLGTQTALEVAANHADRFAGLIVESGAGSLRRLAGFLGLDADSGEGGALVDAHEAKIRRIALPALIIHGERDELIPLSHAAELYSLLEPVRPEMVVIPGAGHNDLLWIGAGPYFDAIERFIDRLRG